MKNNMISRFSVMKFCRNKVRRRRIALIAAVALAVYGPLQVLALDVAHVTGQTGEFGTMNTTGAGTATGVTTIQQLSKGGVLDWSQFNLVQGERANFLFNQSGSTLFNLVAPTAGKSQIDGIINGNNGGNVWVVNPNGIAFGAGAQVNVGGLFSAVAGTLENAVAIKGAISGNASWDAPSFTMGGNVDVASGAALAADRIAMAGRKVTIESGAALAGNTTLGAYRGGKVTIDDVNGGDRKSVV